jgi:hypothetical protein
VVFSAQMSFLPMKDRQRGDGFMVLYCSGLTSASGKAFRPFQFQRSSPRNSCYMLCFFSCEHDPGVSHDASVGRARDGVQID